MCGKVQGIHEASIFFLSALAIGLSERAGSRNRDGWPGSEVEDLSVSWDARDAPLECI